MKVSLPRPSRVARATALVACAALLAGCASSGSGNLNVRTGPQAVHPSTSTLARGTIQAPAATSSKKLSQGSALDLGNSLFDEFCLNKSGAEQTEAALRASGRFKAPRVTEFGNGATRYVFYDLNNGTRGGVTVTYGTGIQCAVGVENRGATLFENGRITRA